MSFLRTIGSPPVKRNMYVPISLAWLTMLSISSYVRLSLLPYSAAQQPVQWRLHALVGSMSMAQGTLQPCSSLTFCWRGIPIRALFMMKFSNIFILTPSSMSSQSDFMNFDQLGSFSTASTPCIWEVSIPSVSKRLAHSISFGRHSSGG